MKELRIILVIIFLHGFFHISARAQELKYRGYTDFYNSLTSENPNGSEVKIYQDDEVNNLIQKHIDYNRRPKGIPGYRIRIFSERGNEAREHMFEQKSRFLVHFPDINPVERYEAPNWKLYVGNYITKSEAIKALNKIRKHFPYAFISNDWIKPVSNQ